MLLLWNLPTSQRIAILFISLILLSISNIGPILYFIEIERLDGAIIDISGRNRMLSQKIGLYAHLIVHGEKEKDLDVEEFKKILYESIILHDRSLSALRYGGIIIDISGNRTIPPTTNAVLSKVLDSEKVWKTYMENGLIIVNEPTYLNGSINPKVLASLDLIQLNAPEMLIRNDKLVKAYVKRNDTNQQNMRYTIIFMIILNSAVLLFTYRELRAYDIQKTKFIQDISHQLKTPLSVAMAAHDLMKTAHNQKKYAEYSSILARNLSILSDSIQSVLELYEIDIGKQYSKDNVSINDLINSIVAQQRPIAKKKEIQLIVKTEPIPEIIGDRDALTTVIENLITNALKFTKKGKITITTGRKGKNIFVSVRDTGIGIPKEAQKRIFSRFYKVNPLSPGTGIGLSINRHLIKAHGGKISFKSTPGKGTVFTFTLPIGKIGNSNGKNINN